MDPLSSPGPALPLWSRPCRPHGSHAPPAPLPHLCLSPPDGSQHALYPQPRATPSGVPAPAGHQFSDPWHHRPRQPCPRSACSLHGPPAPRPLRVGPLLSYAKDTALVTVSSDPRVTESSGRLSYPPHPLTGIDPAPPPRLPVVSPGLSLPVSALGLQPGCFPSAARRPQYHQLKAGDSPDCIS